MPKPLLFDTRSPDISGFSIAHAYEYKTKRQAKMKRRQRQMTFLLISHRSIHVPEKQMFGHRPKNEWRISKRSVVLLRRQTFKTCVRFSHVFVFQIILITRSTPLPVFFKRMDEQV